MNGEGRRIVLKMSGAAKAVYIPTVAVSVVFSIIFIGILLVALSEESAKDIGIAAAGLAFFGVGAILIVRLMITSAGHLELRPDGLLVDTYISSGFIPWQHLKEIASARAMGVRYLGIEIEDVDAYLASATRKDVTRSRDRLRARAYMALMLQMFPDTILNIILGFLGYTNFPKSPTERDILQWNAENFGYHILIQSFWFSNLDQTVTLISSERSARQPT